MVVKRHPLVVMAVEAVDKLAQIVVKPAVLVVAEHKTLVVVPAAEPSPLKLVVLALVALVVELTHPIHLDQVVAVVGMVAVEVLLKMRHLLAVVQDISILPIFLVAILSRAQERKDRPLNGQLTHKEMDRHK
jgi:hypothetical protein